MGGRPGGGGPALGGGGHAAYQAAPSEAGAAGRQPMSGSPRFMLDRAYWDPGLLAEAAATEAAGLAVNAFAIYAWDHYLSDQGGFCGGYSPGVVAALYGAGYDVHFVFCFRDGEAPPDYPTCLRVLESLGARPGSWVHEDIENGATDNLGHAQGFTAALQAAGYRSAPYGLASTLRLGYLAGASGAWVASYTNPWNRPPDLLQVPNVGAWDFIGWQYSLDSPGPLTVDLSVHDFPAPGEESTQMNMQIKQAWATLFYFAALGRFPESFAVRDALAAQIKDDGSNLLDVFGSVVTSSEGERWMPDEQSWHDSLLRGSLPPGGGQSGLADHTHAPGPVQR